MQGELDLGWFLDTHSVGISTFVLGIVAWTWTVTVASVTSVLELGKGGGRWVSGFLVSRRKSCS